MAVMEDEDYWYSDGVELFKKLIQTIQKEKIGKWDTNNEGKVNVTFTFTKSELRALDEYFQREKMNNQKIKEKIKVTEKFFDDLDNLLPSRSSIHDTFG
jgi:hypothetical protein